jgi:hypothetical protein
MGVDFERCETCHDIFCDDGDVLKQIQVKGLGTQNVCKACLETNFLAAEPSFDDQCLMLSESGMIFYIAPADKDEPKRGDIAYFATSPIDVLDWIEDQGTKPTDYCFGFFDDEEEHTKRMQPYADEPVFYSADDGGHECCIGEAFDTYVSQQKKLFKRNVLQELDLEYEAKKSWIKMQIKEVDHQMERLQTKRRKLEEL